MVALGGNLGDPVAALRAAARAVARLGAVRGASHLYRSAAVGGPEGQPDYLNAVLVLEPAPPWRTPERLLHALLAIERAGGRVRRERWGPRTIDLDLVDLGGLRRTGRDLELPHPRAVARPFVVVPLAEVWPAWHAPDGRSAADLARAAPSGAALRTPLALLEPPPARGRA